MAASVAAFAQYPALIHSHNDYKRVVPFYQAYAQKVASIECDMYHMGGDTFYVGHELDETSPDITFDNTYLEPVLRAYRLNGGHAWADDPGRHLQLLVEIKSDDPDAFLKALAEKLGKYPEVFDRSVNPMACQIAITGNRPDPSEWHKYPSFIKFDGLLGQKYTPEQLERVALISECFGDYSQWNGKGSLVYKEEMAVREAIRKAHALGKPIRFWGCPDTVTTWYTWINFGIDYINTDNPEMCCEFLSDWNKKTFGIHASKGDADGGIARAVGLDKTTRSFAGFSNDRMRLDEPVRTYSPTYLNDGADGVPVKNVILMIGDGMGLQQMIAADRVNFGLTMMNIRHIGMVNNSSEDAFTTDSAASGSALATGLPHRNRHISAASDGTPNPSLTEYFHDMGKATAVVTLGNMSDATPAAFYGHSTERDSSDVITRSLLDGKLTVLAGSGIKTLTTDRRDGIDIIGGMKKLGYGFETEVEGIDDSDRKVICIDEEMSKATDAGNVGLLAEATRRTIAKCAKAGGENGFFIMVEGAKIDYAGHSRYLPGSVMETLSFDLAIAEALKFADSNGETLVIVTSDHECGALVLVDGNNETGSVTGYYLSNDHTPAYPIVLSYGPGAKNFIGRYLQTDIAGRIKDLSCRPPYAQQAGGPSGKYKLPFKNTYNKEPLVTENEYRTMKPWNREPGSFADARKRLPSPLWKGHEKEVEMYWKAWEIAWGNIRQPESESGFVSPYLDIAYNGNIFMWDMAFMMMFAHYGNQVFPFVNSMDNFYSHQHPDGFICREIHSDGSDCFERYDPVSTGPNLLPMAEMKFFRQYGDNDRLFKVFPALCAYNKWLQLNRTWPDGSYWSSGWGSGMDNMPRVGSGYNPIYSNGHMTWLDTMLQQYMVDRMLLDIGFHTERWQEIEDFEDEMSFLKKYVNENMWDEKTGFLYDRNADGSLCKTKGISAFWALQTDILDKDRMDRLVEHLSDSSEFARTHMVPSLSADHPKYKDNGRYWQGGVWPGANYMVIDGLYKQGYKDLAYKVAANDYVNILEIYKNTGTFWEYCAPETAEPGFMARKNFVGWGGLAPISEFIEFILGIHSDCAENLITWELNQTEAHGIDRLPFGTEGLISLQAASRANVSQTPKITVSSNVEFDLVVNWGDGKSSGRIHVSPGKKISLKL